MPRPPHDCPGCPDGDKAQVPYSKLACRRDWYRLPRDLQLAVNEAYRDRHHNPDAHRAAVMDAVEWYADHPRTTP